MSGVSVSGVALPCDRAKLGSVPAPTATHLGLVAASLPAACSLAVSIRAHFSLILWTDRSVISVVLTGFPFLSFVVLPPPRHSEESEPLERTSPFVLSPVLRQNISPRFCETHNRKPPGRDCRSRKAGWKGGHSIRAGQSIRGHPGEDLALHFHGWFFGRSLRPMDSDSSSEGGVQLDERYYSCSDLSPSTPPTDDNQQVTDAPEPEEYDNFYTPQNKAFYDSNPYQELNIQEGEIRILRIFPKKCSYQEHAAGNRQIQWPETDITEEPVIACQLLDQLPLRQIESFVSLSYCAGSPHNTRRIIVNGRYFNVFANLAHAIDGILACWPPNKELFLWTDQVCINQCDQMERASQVSMMQRIYHGSTEVYVCLSTADYENTSSTSDIVSLRSPSVQDPWMLWTSMGKRAKATFPRRHPTRGELEARLRRHLEDERFLKDWLESLREVLTVHWWSRAWVYQEFIMAQQPYFLWRGSSIPWSDLSPLLQFVCNDIDGKIKDWTSDSLAMAELTNRRPPTRTMTIHEGGRLSRLKLERENLRKKIAERAAGDNDEATGLVRRMMRKAHDSRTDHMKKKLREVEDEIQQLQRGPVVGGPAAGGRTESQSLRHKRKGLQALASDLESLSAERKRVLSLVRGKTTRTRDLKELLQHSRNCKSSDPRDRVYAFLGLSQGDTKLYNITPSYDKANSVKDVLIETARAIIERDKSLEILRHVKAGRRGYGRHTLPTWVPDWTSEEEPWYQDFRSENNLSDIPRGFRARQNYSSAYEDGTQVRSISKLEYHLDMSLEGSKSSLPVQGCLLGRLGDVVPGMPRTPFMHWLQLEDATTQALTLTTAHFDDEIWVLRGCSSYVALRPEKQRPGCYAFLGEAKLSVLSRDNSPVIDYADIRKIRETSIESAKDIFLI